jgi:hypothetical protein
MRGTEANDGGHAMGGPGLQTPGDEMFQNPPLHVAMGSQLGSGLVPSSHCSPSTEHGDPCVTGLAGVGQVLAGAPLLPPLVPPPEVEPLPLLLPPEPDPLLLPLPLPPLPPPLLLPEPELLPPSLFPASDGPVKVAPPQATAARSTTMGALDRVMGMG